MVDTFAAQRNGIKTGQGRRLLCLVGTDKFTDGQWVALARLVRELCAQYGIPLQPADPKDPRGLRGVIGHGQLPGVAKRCPGFDVRRWLAGGMVAPLGQLQQA